MFARLGQFVARQPWLVIAFWFVLFAIAAPLASRAPQALSADTSTTSRSQAREVEKILKDKFKETIVERTILVSESSLMSDSPEFKEGYEKLIAQLQKIPGVNAITRFDSDSPLKLQSEDKKVTATILETKLENPRPLVEKIRKTIKENQISGTTIHITGTSAVSKDFVDFSESDTKTSEVAALPLTALILILAFGALLAAGVPLAVGLISITISLAFVYLLTRFMPVSSFALPVITMLGLGAGIDYALLMVNRFREELANGFNPRAAAANTTKTAGRSVAFSGLTVAIAMASLLVPQVTFVRSMGIGGVMVVLITVLASITLVPAILALIGDRINWPSFLSKRFNLSGRGGPFWGRLSETVMNRPWIFSFVIISFLLLLAFPATRMKLGYAGAFGLAPGIESRRGLELIKPIDLGGSMDTFEVLVDLGKEQAYDSTARRKLQKLDQILVGFPDVRLVISPFLVGRTEGGGSLTNLIDLTTRSISEDRRYLRLSVIPKQPIHAPEISRWMDRLTNAVVNAGFEKSALGGSPIGTREFSKALIDALPIAVAIVFVATFILLMIAFRSLVIPLKSIIMNTLTVGASYGIITLVIQEGFLASFFNIPRDVGVIDASLPIIMFAVTFGLSMDYEIFLLSRVQEMHLQGLDTRSAVREAITKTAGVITSAALIMFIVFAAFIQGSVVANKTIGLGLAVAVFLDATLVRLILVPAVLVLAGEWNWWMPNWLKKVLPKISLEH